jgi:hypothetical protein
LRFLSVSHAYLLWFVQPGGAVPPFAAIVCNLASVLMLYTSWCEGDHPKNWRANNPRTDKKHEKCKLTWRARFTIVCNLASVPLLYCFVVHFNALLVTLRASALSWERRLTHSRARHGRWVNCLFHWLWKLHLVAVSFSFSCVPALVCAARRRSSTMFTIVCNLASVPLLYTSWCEGDQPKNWRANNPRTEGRPTRKLAGKQPKN